jgi:hypothetical protein
MPWAQMRQYTTAAELAFRVIADALRGVPADAPAAEVDLRLRVQVDHTMLPMSYSTWRRAVRAVQAERARWCRWEGKNPDDVGPRARSRVRGVGRRTRTSKRRRAR